MNMFGKPCMTCPHCNHVVQCLVVPLDHKTLEFRNTATFGALRYLKVDVPVGFLRLRECSFCGKGFSTLELPSDVLIKFAKDIVSKIATDALTMRGKCEQEAIKHALKQQLYTDAVTVADVNEDHSRWVSQIYI